jgi:uncharacterized membrane protein HdeD (DUF308 family)
MPKNRFIYVGVLVIAACALLFGAWSLGNLVLKILPYAAATGAALIVVGIVTESNKSKAAALAQGLKPGEIAADNVKDTR